MSLATPIPLQRLCVLATVSRAGFYRWRHAPPSQDVYIDLRDQIQRIALEWPCYGWRRVTVELRRRGWKPGPGLVHHSDRGVQYASGNYTDVLKDNKVRISMSRKGNPYDNATCESFMKTLKYEEVYRQEYRDLAEARASIGQFLNKVYNQQRLHSALGYLPPVEFEQSLSQATGSEAVA